MRDILTQVRELKRPQSLVQSARFGVADYKRDRHLKGVLKTDHLPSSGESLIELLFLERDMNHLRYNNTGGYTYRQHIEILIAIMGETQILQAAYSVGAE